MAVTSQWQSASDEDWALALAREAVIRPLTEQPGLNEELVTTASAELAELVEGALHLENEPLWFCDSRQ